MSDDIRVRFSTQIPPGTIVYTKSGAAAGIPPFVVGVMKFGGFPMVPLSPIEWDCVHFSSFDQPALEAAFGPLRAPA